VGTLLLGTGLLCTEATALASSDMGGDCVSCHWGFRRGMELRDHHSLTGGLKTYEVAPGQAARISFDVFDGSQDYAVGLSGLDRPGLDNGARLDYTVTPGLEWQPLDGGAYYASNTHTTPGQLDFDLQVNADSSPDLYLLEAQLAGTSGELWAQVEDFYLRVLSSAPAFGAVTPAVLTGFEQAAAGSQTFIRSAGDDELEWTSAGAVNGWAAVDNSFNDPNDPANSRQFHIHQADVALQTELIDVREFVDVQVSVDLRIWDEDTGFENDDEIDLRVATSTDGVAFNEFFFLQLDGAATDALNTADELGNGAFSTFTTPPGYIPDDVATLQIIAGATVDAAGEHVFFDNLRVSGTPAAALSTLRWDAAGNGVWGEVNGITGLSHWLDAAGSAGAAIPNDETTNAVLPADNVHTVTVAADRQIRGLSVEGGTLAVGADRMLSVVRDATFGPGTTLQLDRGARLSVRGGLTLAENSRTAIRLGNSDSGRIITPGGNVNLGGALLLQPTAVDPADIDSVVRREIVEATGGGAIVGVFDTLPPSPGDGEPVTVGHLGLGVFNLGVDYVETNPPDDPPQHSEVAVDLYIAKAADGNADGRIDGQDITTLITNFSRPGDPANRNWLQNDTAGGVSGRGDGFVDGQDITDLITHFTGDAGPPGDGSASAAYDPTTGQFTVSVEGVLSWSLNSNGQFLGSELGSELGGAEDALRNTGGLGLVSANENTVGEGLFQGTLTYDDLPLGQVAPAGTDVGQFALQYITAYGGPVQSGSIHVVPEPGSLVLAALGAVGLLLGWRRRRSHPGEKLP